MSLRVIELECEKTVTMQLPDTPLAAVAVIVVEPTECPVTTPSTTVAMLSSPLLQVKDRSWSLGVTVI